MGVKYFVQYVIVIDLNDFEDVSEIFCLCYELGFKSSATKII